MTAFEDAFRQCLADKVYPGPTAINERRAPHFRKHKRMLNGRDTTRRLEMMHEYEIPYKRTGAYGRKGEVPNLPWMRG